MSSNTHHSILTNIPLFSQLPAAAFEDLHLNANANRKPSDGLDPMMEAGGTSAASAASAASTAAALAMYNQQSVNNNNNLNSSCPSTSTQVINNHNHNHNHNHNPMENTPVLEHSISNSSLSQDSHRDSISSQSNLPINTNTTINANLLANDGHNNINNNPFKFLNQSLSGNPKANQLNYDSFLDKVPAGYPPQYVNIFSNNNGTSKHSVNLPQHFNTSDKSQYLSVTTDGLQVFYAGPGNNDTHAGSIRTDHPIPRQCGIYYFEILIDNRGRNGYIGIGLSAGSTDLDKLPGWEKTTWGYHGDDGHAFACSGIGKAYGPTFTTGDTIGCIINFFSNTISFTKNGMWLGVAFKNVSEDFKRSTSIYPAVGLRTQGEKVVGNFGESRFTFDFQGYFDEEQKKLWSAINATPLINYINTENIKTEKSDANVTNNKNKSSQNVTGTLNMNDLGRVSSTESSATSIVSNTETKNEQLQQQNLLVHNLILSYLIHHGYTETAMNFIKKTNLLDIKLNELNNNEISSNTQNKEELLKKLIDSKDVKLRHSIKELILNGNYESSLLILNENYQDIISKQPNVIFYLECGKFIEMINNYYKNDPNFEFQDMIIDNKNNNNEFENKVSMEDILETGQQIYKKYSDLSNTNVKKSLLELFSLIAYPNPYNSPVSHLLNPLTRVRIADLIDFSILKVNNKPIRPPLEVSIRQSAVILDLLRKHEYAVADIFSIPANI